MYLFWKWEPSGGLSNHLRFNFDGYFSILPQIGIRNPDVAVVVKFTMIHVLAELFVPLLYIPTMFSILFIIYILVFIIDLRMAGDRCKRE
jgi:hypothetical protein